MENHIVRLIYAHEDRGSRLVITYKMPFNSIINAFAKEGSCMDGRWISWSDTSNCNIYCLLGKNMHKEDLNINKKCCY
ncbi:hypothetical protein TSUD_277240 [Trifolium subterraneum]|uniref:Uncharacterized protein n=1 Tax=Trifolium subterraneum TaxID=3900 RepID=A0A2Z6NHN9_TRISU|nr:hypothetical protein TSUD_277240 [Trifolium subterraneum]